MRRPHNRLPAAWVPRTPPLPSTSGSNTGARSHHAGNPRTAIDILAGLLHYFEGFGPGGKLVFLFVVLCLDAMLFPALPELFVMGFYATDPTLEWGIVLLAVVIVAELSGNGLLYLSVKRFGLPKFLEKTMKSWMGFLVVRDERVILVNRVAPILPFVGAFVATMKWNPKRAFLYIFAGGAVKYAILIAFVGVFFQLFDGNTARNATISAIMALIIVSFVQGYFARKKHLGPVAARVAHLGDKSLAGAPAGAAHQEEHGGHSGRGEEKQ